MNTVALVILVAALAETSGFLIKVPTVPSLPRLLGWVHLQKRILPLFENVCEDSTNPIIVRLAQEFDLDSSSGIYLRPEVIANFKNLKAGKGFLTKGEIFTEYDADHINELRVIYDILYYAKEFDTFYKTAAWARQNINCGLFVDAIYLAILNRRDTEKLSVPAPYELLPNYFIRKDVILKASSLLSGEEIAPSESVRVDGNAYVLDANYTSNFYNNDDESKMAYFNEDIGLNCYYFLQKIKMAPWFNTLAEMRIGYGEYLYHIMKQLTTRYNLERYSNGLPEVETIDWNSFMVTPYDPMLIYSNGNEFSQRTTSSGVSIDADVELIQNIESNIAMVVSHMRGTGYNKTQILNHLMEILITRERSYGTLARRLISKDVTSKSQLTVLDHYLTSLRDPVFWKLNSKIVKIINDALKSLPAYTRNELLFPGLEILNIDVKKMMTVFDYFQFDVTDALKSATSNTTFQVKIGQPRLNHKPFNIKLNISSLVTQKGLVKIYLGPKIAPGEYSSKKHLFMLFDSFEFNFKMGINIISRTSQEIKHLSEDFTLFTTLRKKVEDAEFGLDALSLSPIELITGFPSRLILPKGTPEGLPLQIFVFVAPLVKVTVGRSYSLSSTEYNSAALSPGYPLDLDVEDAQLFGLPNAMAKDFTISHKGDSKITNNNYGGPGVTKKWQSSGSYDPSSRPDFGSKRKEPFDYSSKKGQYGKKEDYSAKRGGYYKGNQDTVVDNKSDNNNNTLPDLNDVKLVEKVELNQEIKDDLFLVDTVEGKPLSIAKNEAEDYVITETPLFMPTVSKLRLPSIFDYLLPQNDDDDYTENKVYE